MLLQYNRSVMQLQCATAVAQHTSNARSLICDTVSLNPCSYSKASNHVPTPSKEKTRQRNLQNQEWASVQSPDKLNHALIKDQQVPKDFTAIALLHSLNDIGPARS